MIDNKRAFHKSDQVTYGGITTLSITSLISLISRDQLSTPLCIAMLCMSIASPISSAILMRIYFEKEDSYDGFTTFVTVSGIFSCCLTLIGIAAMFAHFSWVFVITFVASCVISVGIFSENELIENYRKGLASTQPEDDSELAKSQSLKEDWLEDKIE